MTPKERIELFVENCANGSLKKFSETTGIDASHLRSCRLGNIFNSHHACSGWVYSAICDSYGNPDESRYTEIGYIPSAGFNLLASYTIRF